MSIDGKGLSEEEKNEAAREVHRRREERLRGYDPKRRRYFDTRTRNFVSEDRAHNVETPEEMVARWAEAEARKTMALMEKTRVRRIRALRAEREAQRARRRAFWARVWVTLRRWW